MSICLSFIAHRRLKKKALVFWWYPLFNSEFLLGFVRAVVHITSRLFVILRTTFLPMSASPDWLRSGVALCCVPLKPQSQVTLQLRPVSQLALVSTPPRAYDHTSSCGVGSQSCCCGCRLWPDDRPLCCQKYHFLLIVIIFNFAFIVIIIMTLKKALCSVEEEGIVLKILNSLYAPPTVSCLIRFVNKHPCSPHVSCSLGNNVCSRPDCLERKWNEAVTDRCIISELSAGLKKTTDVLSLGENIGALSVLCRRASHPMSANGSING